MVRFMHKISWIVDEKRRKKIIVVIVTYLLINFKYKFKGRPRQFWKTLAPVGLTTI